MTRSRGRPAAAAPRPRGCAAVGIKTLTAPTILVALLLSGCVGDPKRVDRATDRRAFHAASSLIEAVRRGAFARACSGMTIEARFELRAWAGAASCREALAGRAFRDLCGGFWAGAHAGTTVYRKDDVDGFQAKPGVAWFVLSRDRRLTGRCELRLVREGERWRVDGIARTAGQAVIAKRRDELVFRDRTPVRRRV